ncbi:alginate lyase family protein [Mariniblastus sp.]|nr:alginate lyase family protein [Mariniblastus sp.]
MSGESLAKTKQRIAARDSELKSALSKLTREADFALSGGPYSVTDNQQLASGADKHDYSSFGRYWWPDPSGPDGLPYIRRDGKTNPDSQSPKTSDRSRIELMSFHVETLGLAYYLTGKEKYAVKAAELLRVWFLDPATRMNPNLNYSQGRPGHTDGSSSGVLDGRIMVRAFEGSLLIKGSSAFSEAEHAGLKAWAAKYFSWLQTSELANDAAAKKNNHSTFFDVQAIYFALYCGDKKAAIKIAEEAAAKRVLAQISPDGSMPEEMSRTRPFHYGVFNLHSMLMLANLGDRVGVQIWSAGDSRLSTAVDFFAPYTDPAQSWPGQKIKESDRMKMFPILLMANEAYPEKNYLQFFKNLPSSKSRSLRENLAFPLMR